LLAPNDPQQWQRHQQLWRQEGERRLGTAGGTARLAEAIIGGLEVRPKPPSKQTQGHQPSSKQWP